jgi:hypothetical protein
LSHTENGDTMTHNYLIQCQNGTKPLRPNNSEQLHPLDFTWRANDIIHLHITKPQPLKISLAES